jgi:hypothetical protein
MKIVLVVTHVVAFGGGGILGYLYGAHVYSQAEKVIQAAKNLEVSAKARLKALL